MASTKTVVVLDDDVTLTAGAAAHASTQWTMTTGYGGILGLKNTNGATGPTVAAQSQVWWSPLGTATYATIGGAGWYKLGGPIAWPLGNNVSNSVSVPIPKDCPYVAVISGSNTGQDTVIRVEGSQMTATS